MSILLKKTCISITPKKMLTDKGTEFHYFLPKHPPTIQILSIRKVSLFVSFTDIPQYVCYFRISGFSFTGICDNSNIRVRISAALAACGTQRTYYACIWNLLHYGIQITFSESTACSQSVHEFVAGITSSYLTSSCVINIYGK